MGISVILLCKEGESRQAYLNEANANDVEVDTVSNYCELFEAMRAKPYQGILIDLITNMKSPREEKNTAKQILDTFPLVQLKLENETGIIRTISFGSSSESESLTDFINKECRIFTPRTIRLSTRKGLHFNVTMSKDEDMNEILLEYSVTMDASQGGCFLFSAQDWEYTSTVWFIINELRDKSPIKGDIRWVRSWGKNMLIPGMGIRFEQIKPGQLEELTDNYSLY